MLSAGDAVKTYRDEMADKIIAPAFMRWWFWHETRHEDEDGKTLGPFHPDHYELSFSEWKAIRNVPDIDCPL
jgi:hypothetical protein